MPRISAGALLALSATFTVACGDSGGTTAGQTDTDTGTDTDTAGPTGTDSVDPTNTTTNPGTTDVTTTGTPTDTSDSATTDAPTSTTTTGTDTDAITSTTSTTTTETDTGPGTTDTTTTEADTSTSTSSGTDTDTSSSSTGDTDTGGPVKPEDCVDLPLAEIELVSQQQHQFDSSGTVPTIRSPQSHPSLSGDPALFDLLRILFDGDLGVGVHPLDPDPNHAIPNFMQNFVTISNAAVVLQEDQSNGAYAKVFVAVAGELELIELLTPHQSRGSVRHVELREMALNPDTSLLEPVDGGACYWIEEAEYDVRRPNGCIPHTPGACPDEQFCMPTNAIGSDGECVTGGDKQAGEACERANPTLWDSDCALGLRCIDFGDGFECGQVCDVRSDAPGCAAGTHCGGGYNLCLDEALLQESGVDPALVGEPCEDDPEAGYCGGDGRPGLCYDDDAEGPNPSTCRAFASAPSQCVAPQTAGYVAYKNQIDRSTLWCFTP